MDMQMNFHRKLPIPKDLKEQFKIARAENDRLLRNANIDLIQLMEQGDQVIKSPWSSWQFGINYMYDGYLNGEGTYRGRGDNDQKRRCCYD